MCEAPADPVRRFHRSCASLLQVEVDTAPLDSDDVEPQQQFKRL